MDEWLARYRVPLLLALPLTAAVILLLIPTLVLLRYSFLVNIPGKGLTDQPTLENYVVFAADAFLRGGVAVTLGTSVLVTAISLALGFPVAYAYARTGLGPKGLLMMAILSPFYIDVLIKVYAWLVLLGRSGVINRVLLAVHVLRQPVDFRNSYAGIVIILVYLTLPFMILSLIGPLQLIDDGLVEAAGVCGSRPGKVLRGIILPLSVPGVMAGSILVFSVAISTFIVPLLVGGRIGQQFLAVIVYENINVNQNWAVGSAAATILTVVALCIVAAYNWTVGRLRVGTLVSERFAG